MKRIATIALTLSVIGGLVSVTTSAQVAPVDEPAVCFQCHSDIEVMESENHVHTAFSVGKCSSCHNPHASKHAALLDNSVSDMCSRCHNDITDELAEEFVHHPAEQGKCLDCHDPHASAFSNQLNKEMTDLCSTCHPQAMVWSDAEVLHPPAADGECMTCHKPHASTNDHLLVNQAAALCLDCHETTNAFYTAHKGFKIDKADCATCHDPHSSQVAGLLRANQHSPFKAGNCKTCHTQVSTGDFSFGGEVADLCEKCHRSIAGNMELANHQHLEMENSCVNCHNPHASNQTALVKSEQKRMCFNCHFKGEDYPKEHNAYMTHDGMDCTNCHAPHGSDSQNMLKRIDVRLCSDCHVRAHKVSHPVGEDIVNPKTGGSMNCLSCHQLHGADYENYLPLDPKMALCLQCHKK